jgi:hypothetical protein
MDNEEVKVQFPDGRVTWMPRATAQRHTVVEMGGFIVEEKVKVPKHFAPINEDVVMSAEDNAKAEGEQSAAKEDAPKTRKTRGPSKKKH